MRLIDKFVEKVLNELLSFNIVMKKEKTEGDITYHFIQSIVGKARYIYGICDYWDDKFYSKLDLKPELVAIVSDGTVYIVNEYFFGVDEWSKHKDSLPENTVGFDAVVEKENEYVKDVIFPELYKGIRVNEINDSDLISCKKRARSILFSKDIVFTEEKPESIFNENDVANMLCGFIDDIGTEAKRRFEAKKDYWINAKSVNQKIIELMQDENTAEKWEFEIAEGLRNVDAKTVVVEFELNGKKASAKINPDTVLDKLINNDYFNNYSFEVAKHGSELIQKLGAAEWESENGEVLRCKHISKITYKKKDLYVKCN